MALSCPVYLYGPWDELSGFYFQKDRSVFGEGLYHFCHFSYGKDSCPEYAAVAG